MPLPTTLKKRLVRELPRLVERATATLPASTSGDLFTISGGRIKVHAIYGEVTTVIQTQANATKLETNPTTGPTSDLSGTNDITADAVGTRYGIDGLASVAMQAGGAIMCATPPIVDVGTIALNCAATNTGSIKWTLLYSQVDDGASVVAA